MAPSRLESFRLQMSQATLDEDFSLQVAHAFRADVEQHDKNLLNRLSLQRNSDGLNP